MFYRRKSEPYRDKNTQILKEIGKEGNPQLHEALALLNRIRPPSPSMDESLQLVRALAPFLRKEGTPDGADGRAIVLTRVMALVRPQIEAFGRAFWIASAIIMIAGIAALSLMDEGLGLWIHASPLFAVFGVVWGFRSRYYRVSEIEMSCPFSQAQILAARMLLILAYNAAFGLAATIILGGFSGPSGFNGPDRFDMPGGFDIPGGLLQGYASHTFGRLVIGWLGPLCFLAGATLLVSVRFGTGAGGVASLALWGMGQYWYAVIVKARATGPGGLPIPGSQGLLSKHITLAALHAEEILMCNIALLAIGLMLMGIALWQSRQTQFIEGKA